VRAAELGLAALIGAAAALAIVHVGTAVLDRLEPVQSTVLVDAPDPGMIFNSDWTQCVTITPGQPLVQPPVPPMSREFGRARDGGKA
jgi:hypothetical protein